MTPSQPLRSTLLSFVATMILSVTTACAALGNLTDSSKPSASHPAPSVAQPNAAGPNAAEPSAAGTTTGPSAAAPDATIFVGLTEENNAESTRKFKDELRSGLLTRIFDGSELLSEVTAICGTKIWDQCQVAASSGPNELGWPEWTFKRNDAERLYRYPDMFYAKAEPKWSTMAVEYILRSDSGAVLVKMTQDKCGKNFADGCQVRQRHGAGYVLTVKRDGEVINVMDTLTKWRRDL